MPGKIRQIARGGEYLLGTANHLHADLSEGHITGAALHEFSAKFALQLADLHRKRWLGDGAGIGGPSEVPMNLQRGQITQLPQCDHVDKLF
jgi:hypothetical protein